jgi:hypothetical protein
MDHDSMRFRRLSLALLLIASLGTGCVSRNVETIADEEAASMPAPPAPLSPDERAAAAVAAPGFTGAARAADEVTTVPAGILYIIVRVAGREGGPPLAVKRLPGELPAEFTITSDDSMIPGTPLVDAMDVTVRLDQDGDAWSNQAGDLVGSVGGVAIGDAIDVVLTYADATSDQ